jgi:hypothetical protein
MNQHMLFKIQKMNYNKTALLDVRITDDIDLESTSALQALSTFDLNSFWETPLFCSNVHVRFGFESYQQNIPIIGRMLES